MISFFETKTFHFAFDGTFGFNIIDLILNVMVSLFFLEKKLSIFSGDRHALLIFGDINFLSLLERRQTLGIFLETETFNLCLCRSVWSPPADAECSSTLENCALESALRERGEKLGGREWLKNEAKKKQFWVLWKIYPIWVT